MPKFLLAAVALVLTLTAGSAAVADTKDGDPKRNEAIALMKNNKYAEAAKIMERLVEAAPLSANDHYLYGEALLATGKYMEAAVEFKQARNIQPSESLYALKCGEAYMRAQRKDDAVTQCDLGIAQCKDPFYKQALESLKKEILNPYKPPPIIDPEQPRSAKSGGMPK